MFVVRSAIAAVVLALFATVAPSHAQLLAAKDAPVAYGHHHLNVTDIPAAQKFLADALGGAPITVAGRQIVKFPNVLVLMRQQKPTAGTKGSSVDHLGFSVPDDFGEFHLVNRRLARVLCGICAGNPEILIFLSNFGARDRT